MHEGADIAGELHLKLMAVVRKGKLTPWSTDHAKWIFANRFFFDRKAAAHGVNLNLRVDAIGHFRMVKKKQQRVELGGTPAQ